MTNDRHQALQTLVKAFTPDTFTTFLRTAAPTFRARPDDLTPFIQPDTPFDTARQLGVIELPAAQTVLVAAVHVAGELTSRTSRRVQYDLAKAIIKAHSANAGLFAFYDDLGHLRLSLVTAHYYGTQRQFSNYRRYTFFVAPDAPNKTFLNQIGRADFSSLDKILQVFSLEAVSDDFYKDFKPHFDAIAQNVVGAPDADLSEDLALLFVIRIIFLGFVQKKGWLGSPTFLQDFWAEYQATDVDGDHFYRDWLAPLFFEALNAPPGRKVAYGIAPFSQATQQILQMAPYLNGELFKRKRGVDDQGAWIPDTQIGAFLAFLFQYNFTVEENELYDEELELNPEFLGIIFERLTNKDQGAVYTPRVEVDLMCRLALVKWLERTTDCDRRDLYHLFFREAGTGESYDQYQRQGDFSPVELRRLIDQLETVTVCDPAAGSGAFEVGMMQVLDQVLSNLYSRNNTPADLKAQAPSAFERKKAIIATSLYGVEVKRWAVWINQLRLWLSLFVDMPKEYKDSRTPLLPNLTFKVRAGDSLVQRLGDRTFPVHGHAALPAAVKRKITALKKRKRDFFYNEGESYRAIEQAELDVFRAILDAEIDAHRAEIDKLLKPRPQQGKLLSLGPEQGELDLEATTAERRAELEAEIAELQARRATLQDERPLIWSIEFAEIFFDRGGFDIVIGNPPYVSKEDIHDPYQRMTPKAYKQALREMVLVDFPDYFAQSRANQHTFRKGRRPDGRSDLFAYFYIRSLRLLNSQGIHVFICSNSWLDAGYGAWLQEFLLRRAPLHFVIDNHARRSFASADINTVITVSSISDNVPTKDTCRFVAFKQPFEDVMLSDYLLSIERATVTVLNDIARICPVTAHDLLEEGSQVLRKSRLRASGKYSGSKWGGKYLRAPDIYFTIREKGQDKLVLLSSIAEVNEGHATGANSYFFLLNSVSTDYDIEPQYLRPGIMRTRNNSFLELSLDHIKRQFLQLPRPMDLWVHDNVAHYVEYGREEILENSKTLMAKKDWWYISDRIPADLLAPCGYGKTVWCAVNTAKAVASNSFTEIRLSSREHLSSIFFTLNSPIGWLFLEIVGRVSLGGGMIKVDPTEYRQLEVVTLSHDLHIPFDRRVEDVFTECGIDPESDVPIAEQEPQPLPDRQALDDVVFDALDLTPEERKEVYRAVCQLVWDRINRARSV